MKFEILYGSEELCQDEAFLFDTLDKAVEEYLNNVGDEGQENVFLDAWKRAPVKIDGLDDKIEELLREHFDESAYTSPEGESQENDDMFRSKAKTFAMDVCKEYKSWHCEKIQDGLGVTVNIKKWKKENNWGRLNDYQRD